MNAFAGGRPPRPDQGAAGLSPARETAPPLAMPEQDFGRGRLVAHPLGWRFLLLRTLVLGGAAAATALGCAALVADLGRDGWQWPDALMLPVFAVLFARLSLSAATAVAGLWPTAAPPTPPGPPRGRTALLFPMHNEETSRVFAAAEAMREALDAAGIGESFELFLLSDSTAPASQAREEVGFARLRARLGHGVQYRRRVCNAGRKAGNIADWVRRHGGAFDFFVALDADSVMEAETLRALAHAMDADPRAGLIQTVPTLIGGTTRLARLQQWATRAHGPLLARGFAAWSGEAGSYWGHNAIVRTAAFAAAAGLPALPGKPPFGGAILSHDFVEAALLRRAGWGVQLRADLGGSHEEPPPTLAALAARDRRWCQGNLQHARILGAAGLHPLSRLHLLDGILAYLAAPLWALFLLAAAAQAALGLAGAGYGLLAASAALLLLPKLPAAWRAPAAAARELALTAALAPVAMVTQTRQIVDILRGCDSGWVAQAREGAVPGFGEALRQHAWHVGLGAAAMLVASLVPAAGLWLLPVALPLLAAPLLARHLARSCAYAGFATREELAPSALLRRVAVLRVASQLDLREGAARRVPLPPAPPRPRAEAQRSPDGMCRSTM